MDLEIAAAWAEVFGLVTILGAAIYSWYQIRECAGDNKTKARPAHLLAVVHERFPCMGRG